MIRIEDQEDVVAMQDAKREINANDDEDLNEFDETNIDGEAGGETLYWGRHRDQKCRFVGMAGLVESTIGANTRFLKIGGIFAIARPHR